MMASVFVAVHDIIIIKWHYSINSYLYDYLPALSHSFFDDCIKRLFTLRVLYVAFFLSNFNKMSNKITNSI